MLPHKSRVWGSSLDHFNVSLGNCSPRAPLWVSLSYCPRSSTSNVITAAFTAIFQGVLNFS